MTPTAAAFQVPSSRAVCLNLADKPTRQRLGCREERGRRTKNENKSVGTKGEEKKGGDKKDLVLLDFLIMQQVQVERESIRLQKER